MTPDSENTRELHAQIVEELSSDATEAGNATTAQWMERTYHQLHQIATSQMRYESCDNTLSATGLVHEVFLRLRTREPDYWMSERHFLSIVAGEMKRVLIDAARRKKTVRRGGDRIKQVLVEEHTGRELAQSIVELNEAIEEFKKFAPRNAELVRLRYFLGLSEVEAAETLGISRATASRQWAFARTWLLDYLKK